jgi:hypothetical protein
VNFHYAIGGGQWLEPELLVQRMRVSSGEQHSAKAPKIGMLDYMFHETEGNAFAAMLWQDVHVSKVCEGCLVRYGASKANLFALMKNTKTQGIVYRAFDDGAWNAGRPVRLSQKAVDRPYVEAGFVGYDFVWRHNRIWRSNDEVERRGVAATQNEGSLSRSSTPSTPSLVHRRRGPAIARTDC